MCRRGAKYWGWLLASWLVAGSAAATVRGIVVGIDKYPSVPGANLDGATNDARDIADALSHGGAVEVVKLLDKNATRASIFKAWDHMLSESKAGDVLLFSFAGHGIQRPERVKGSEKTGMDSALVMSDFARKPPESANIILDDEIGVLLQRAATDQVKVIFLADACHSGTMTRGIDSRVRKFKFRALPPLQRGLDDVVSDTPADIAAAHISAVDLPGIIYLGAVQDNQEAPEALIDDKARGALSWAAGKAIRGAADLNHDGIITDAELTNYVLAAVATEMDGQQQPSVSEKPGGPQPILADPVVSQGTLANALPAPKLPITMSIQHAKLPPEQLMQRLNGARLVNNGSAVLTWDTQRGEILGALGDVVANVHNSRGFGRRSAAPSPSEQATPQPCLVPSSTRGFGRSRGSTAVPVVVPIAVTQSQMAKECASTKKDLTEELPRVQLVIDKFAVIETVRPYAEQQPMVVTLAPEDKLFHEKEPVTLTISGQLHPYFTLFNLSSDGTVNFLYPLRSDGFQDPLQIPPGQSYKLDLIVTPPFGADHFVALASTVPLTKLHATLTQLNGKQAAAALLAVLKTQLATQNIQVAIHGVFTGPIYDNNTHH